MKLLALRCPQCAQPLAPGHDDVIVLGCANCFTVVQINTGGLHVTEVQYAAPAQEKFDAWLPLWIFNGRVHFRSRQTQERDRRSEQDAQQLWGTPRRLYVPAWQLSLHDACALGGRLVQRQPTYQAIPRPEKALLTEATVTPADALKLLEFVVLSVEAKRKDWLKNLSFEIEAGAPALWAVPARRTGSGWQLCPQG